MEFILFISVILHYKKIIIVIYQKMEYFITQAKRILIEEYWERRRRRDVGSFRSFSKTGLTSISIAKLRTKFGFSRLRFGGIFGGGFVGEKSILFCKILIRLFIKLNLIPNKNIKRNSIHPSIFRISSTFPDLDCFIHT